MNIYFWQRSKYMSSKYEIPGDLTVRLERHSKTWFGGCDEAELNVEGSKESLLLLLNLARCGVSIHTEGAVPLWWGYVSRIEVEIEGIVAMVDFENMANDVALAYTLVNLSGNTVGTRQTTAWIKDLDSITEYGDRQLLESGASMNVVAATAMANQKLASLKLPKLVVTTRSNENKNWARIVCKGWYHLLEGRYCVIPTKLALSYQTIGTVVNTLSLTNKFAQAFTVTSDINLQEIEIYAKKTGAPGTMTVSVCAKTDDVTPGSSLASATITEATFSTSYAWTKATLSSPYQLLAGTSYWLVIAAGGGDDSGNNHFSFVLDPAMGYNGGVMVYYDDSNNWVGILYDMPFKLFTNALVETSQQIQNYLIQHGEVFRGVRLDVRSGIFTESFRNGDTIVHAELKAHQESGTSNYRRILSRVNLDRTVDVWEQPAEPSRPDLEYRMDGKIYYLAGSEIEPGYDPVGKWVSVIPITKSSSYFSAINGMNNYFIDACEWDRDGRPSIKPADWKNPNAVRVQNG
jgi:hypothetical protein